MIGAIKVKKSRIFIIDDDSNTLELLKNVFESEGYFVVIDEGKNDVCARIKKCGPDIILLDLLMPDNNGLEIFKKLKSDPTCMSIPVVVLTSHQNFNSKIELLREGVLDYIYKPFRKQELLYRVKNYIEHCSPGNRHIFDEQLVFNQLQEISFFRKTEWIEPKVNKASISGYVYPDVQVIVHQSVPGIERELLERWATEEKMERKFVDVVDVCPVCFHYNISFRNVCPTCLAVQIGKNKEKVLQNEKPSSSSNEYFCDACKTKFSTPAIWGHCLNCDEKFDVSKKVTQKIYAYKFVQADSDSPKIDVREEQEKPLIESKATPKIILQVENRVPENIGWMLFDCIPKAFEQSKVDYVDYNQIKLMLEKMIDNAAPDGTNITMMSLGIENFENYYRRYNAEIMVGLFKNIITVIRKHVRNFDVLSYSSDKKNILLMLPNTHLTLAKIIADRIQNRLSRIQTTFQLEIQLASYPQDGRNADEILTMMEMGIEKINSDIFI